MIYTLWTIFQNHPFIVQKSFSNVVLKAQNPEKDIGYMFDTNCSSLEQLYKKPSACFNKPKGKKKFTFPVFDNNYLSSLKNWNLSLDIVYFQAKHDDIYDYNTQCFMSGGLMIDDIIMISFTDTTKQQIKSVKQYHFFQNKGW